MSRAPYRLPKGLCQQPKEAGDHLETTGRNSHRRNGGAGVGRDRLVTRIAVV